MISNFDDLLKAAHEQEDAQRLLLLFANAESESKKHKSTQRGTVSPVMCVDKLPQDIPSYTALIAEADKMSKDWNLVLITSLSGKGPVAPSTEDAEPVLNQMTNNLTSGQNIAQYVIFDREGNAVSMQAS